MKHTHTLSLSSLLFLADSVQVWAAIAKFIAADTTQKHKSYRELRNFICIFFYTGDGETNSIKAQ